MTDSSILLASTFVFFFGFLVVSTNSAVQIKNTVYSNCLVYTGSTPVVPSQITIASCDATSNQIWTKLQVSSKDYVFCLKSKSVACLAVGSGNKLYLMTKNITDPKQQFSLSNSQLCNVATGTSKCATMHNSDKYVQMETCIPTSFDHKTQTFALA